MRWLPDCERAGFALTRLSSREVLIMVLLDNAGAGFEPTLPVGIEAHLLLLFDAGGRIRTNVACRHRGSSPFVV